MIETAINTGHDKPLLELNEKFRIGELYVEKHGVDSRKNIYELPVKEVLGRSGYMEYIGRL